MPTISVSPTPQIKEKLDGIDLINLAAAELKLKEQRRKMDEKIDQVFGSTPTDSITVKHVTKVESILMESKPRRNKDGESSSKNE